jgi:hypothetical protein
MDSKRWGGVVCIAGRESKHRPSLLFFTNTRNFTPSQYQQKMYLQMIDYELLGPATVRNSSSD